MAIPSESQPGTRLGRSGLASTGFQLGQQIKADEDKERARYEKSFEDIGGKYWGERDSFLQRAGANILDMATDPTYFNAKIGSSEHKKFLRAKQQYKQMLQMSTDNQKTYKAYEQFLAQNPDAVGSDALREYYAMGDVEGDVDIDEYGNHLMNGQPMISSDYLASPPMVSRAEKQYNVSDLWEKPKMIGQDISAKGKLYSPSVEDATAHVNAYYDGRGLSEQNGYLKTFITRDYIDRFGVEPSQEYVATQLQDNRGANEIKMLQQAGESHHDLYKQDLRDRDSSTGSDLVIGGVDTGGLDFVPVGFKKKVYRPDLKTEVDLNLASVSTPRLRFEATDPDNIDNVYFINGFSIDQNGKAYVTGKKINKNEYSKLVNLKGQDIDLEDLGATGESIEDEYIKSSNNLFAELKGKHPKLADGGLVSWNDFQKWVRNEFVPYAGGGQAKDDNSRKGELD